MLSSSFITFGLDTARAQHVKRGLESSSDVAPFLLKRILKLGETKSADRFITFGLDTARAQYVKRGLESSSDVAPFFPKRILKLGETKSADRFNVMANEPCPYNAEVLFQTSNFQLEFQRQDCNFEGAVELSLEHLNDILSKVIILYFSWKKKAIWILKFQTFSFQVCRNFL